MSFVTRLTARQERLEMLPAKPGLGSRPADNVRRVYVWDVVVRVTHWLIALSIFTLAITGIYIGAPFLSSPGDASNAGTMGTFRTVHFVGAIVFTLTVLVRVYWAFAGSPPARWPNFIPVTRRRRSALKESLLFYLFRRKSFPPMLSHNPIAGLVYLALFGLYFIVIFTGLGIYGASSDSYMGFFAFFADVFGGLQWARWIHHASMWLILAFLVQHIYTSILASTVEKNGTLESMFSGYKWIKDEDLDK